MGKKNRSQADLIGKQFYGKDGESKSFRQAMDESKVAKQLRGARRKERDLSDDEDLDESELRGDPDITADMDTDEEENGDDELAMEIAALQGTTNQREHKNDVPGLEAALAKCRQVGPTGKKLGFVERLVTTGTKTCQEIVTDVHDDLQREATFYAHTLEGVKASFERLDALGMKYQRPDDYYAEMIKTDHHMEKVKTKLLGEKERIDEKEEKRKQRDNKKLGKQIQAERTQAKAKQKNSDLNAIKQWRKDRKKNNDMGGDAGGALDQAIAGTYKGGPKKQGGKPAASVNRQYKDAKFGYGGMKRRAKQNDKASADDMSQFSARANKAPVPGVKGKAIRTINKKRPGKSARQKR